MSIARATDFPTSGAFQIASLNDELDKLTAMIQQVETDTKYSPKFPQTTATGFNLTFPELVANKVISVNSAGTALEAAQSIVDVTTVAGIASDITTVSGIAANVTTVAGIAANVTAVAGDATDIGAVAAKATEIGLLGTADAIADMAILGTADAVADMNTLANSDIVSDLNLLATSDIVTDLNTLATSANVTNMATLGAAGVVGHITTVAGISANVTAVAGDATDIGTVATDLAGSNNIGTVASNISNVDNFAARYRISTNNPVSSLDAGDLAYITNDNAVKYYNGSAWVALTADTDVKVLVSANDTTAGYLNGKLVAGEAVTFTENSDGGNETLTIAATDPTPLAIALG